MLATIGLSPLAVGGICSSSPAAQPRGATQKPANSVELRGVAIPMRDGKPLIGDVWLPKSSGRFPAILTMTPYNRKLLGAALPNPEAELELPDLTHYAFVMVDWRGFFGSKSAGGLRSASMAQHGKDGYDIVEWIARQKWSNGKVGLWGPSATGKVQYAVAAQKPPHLTCIVPLAAAYGYRYEQFYYGGALRKGYVDTLGKVGYGPQRMVKAHPSKDNFWKQIERTTRNVPAIDVPALLVTGWFDLDGDSVIRTFHDLIRHAGPKAKAGTGLVIGPWHHTAFGKLKQGDLTFPEAVGAAASESTRFFDRYLRGKPDPAAQPRVRYFQTGTNRWLTASSFPPPVAGNVTYYFHPDEKLATKASDENKAGRQFRHDPNDPSPTVGGMNAFIPKDPNYRKVGAGPRDQRPQVESRPDCLLYTTDVLGENVVLGGNAAAVLFVSSDRVDTDFAIRLCDVHPDGRSMLVTDGIQRMRFRNAADRPELIKPGQVYEVTVTLAVTSHVFLEGHRIRVIVSSANTPRFDVNPNLARKRLIGPSALVATNRVHHDREHPSALTLPRWAVAENK